MKDMVAVDDCRDEAIADGDLQIADCREVLDALAWECPLEVCEDRDSSVCHRIYCERTLGSKVSQVCSVLCRCECHDRKG